MNPWKKESKKWIRPISSAPSFTLRILTKDLLRTLARKCSKAFSSSSILKRCFTSLKRNGKEKKPERLLKWR
jgi:hypothetical protein